ncbi:MAG TPA: penicillin-binding protein [Candidatus Acidoferrales bacterium]|nr:penicillin-binding protein [Candidatus Acidoferrales bacterium]
MKAGTLRMRIAATAGVFFMLFLVALARAFQLCVMEGGSLHELATRQQRQRVAVPPERGPIVDRHGDALALTAESAAVFVRPRTFHASTAVVPALARTLGLTPALVAQKVNAPEPFVWLARAATPEQADAVAMLGVPGVGSESSRRRYYPRGALAGQILGFSGVDSQGLEGVELAYDRYLRGTAESLSVERDARGRRLLTEGMWQPLPRQGARVELTIDASLQQVTELELNAAVSARQAAAGVAAVMDPSTGEILALASVPSFDPNRVGGSAAEQWRNRVVADSYEPGSTFKGILAAAAIEAGVVRADERIFCENGHYTIGRRVVHDHEPYGWLTFADVIKHSSNIGAGKIGERLGTDRFAAVIKAFGFGALTGVDLPGEIAGLVRPPSAWARINLVTTSFGQGIAVTPLQLLGAYAAIANGGKLMRPYIVRRVVAPDGSVLDENAPQIVGKPITPRTARAVTDLLRGVVEGGTGTEAHIDGIPVAGKTGTAQKVDPKTGRYAARQRMSSFIGFVPADAPRFVILVVIDSPKNATYGGVVAAPVFRRIAEYGIDRLGLRVAPVPPPAPEGNPVPTQVVNWTATEAEHGMPSFIGLSMRDALVRAVRAGWEVHTQGSGYVVTQEPPPGAETAKGRTLELRFGSATG